MILCALCIILLLTWQYGLGFTFIKPGNYVGPTGIYGVTALYATVYVLLVFVAYEFLTERNAAQSIIYTLLGYFYLDSIVQIHLAFSEYYPMQMYGDTTLTNTALNVLANMDVIYTLLLSFILLLFHMMKNQPFHFGLNRLIFFFAVFGAVFYVIYPSAPFNGISLFIPLAAYVLSSKNIVMWKNRIKHEKNT